MKLEARIALLAGLLTACGPDPDDGETIPEGAAILDRAVLGTRCCTLSEVSGASSPDGGGMHRTRVLPATEAVVLAYDTTFHGWNQAGSAALSCE